MEIGEAIGILFLVGLLAIFGVYFYHTNRCPGCGAFRSIERVDAEYIPVDDETSYLDVIGFFLSEGEHRTKGTIVKWVDRCNKCDYELRGEGHFRHY